MDYRLQKFLNYNLAEIDLTIKSVINTCITSFCDDAQGKGLHEFIKALDLEQLEKLIIIMESSSILIVVRLLDSINSSGLSLLNNDKLVTENLGLILEEMVASPIQSARTADLAFTDAKTIKYSGFKAVNYDGELSMSEGAVVLGKVDKYFSDKGFGFIKPILSSVELVDSIFFHISTIKDKSLSNKLKSEEFDNSYFCWFSFRLGPKGYEVITTIRKSDVVNKISDREKLISKLELYWIDTTNSMPEWVELASITLGLDVENLSLKRNIKKAEIKKLKTIEEQSRFRQENTTPKEEYERVVALSNELRQELKVINGKLFSAKRRADVAEDKWKRALNSPSIFEFDLLVNEIEILNVKLTKSHEVSRYIVDNRLGDKYQNLAGELEMENDSSQWKFDGAIAPKYYKKLCERLGLTNKNTYSKVRKFVSYKDLHNR